MKKQLSLAQRVNVLRAAVMGANDGILSVAGIVIGVAGATTNSYAIFISGMAGMLAGTVSMAMGEYVSVNTQKDSQRKAIIDEKQALKDHYDTEFEFVKQKYVAAGIEPDLAAQATREMMAEDALVTTVRERHGFEVGQYTSPYDAALASMIAFPIGSILPMLAITLLPVSVRVIATFCSVLLALSLTGYSAAALGNANKGRAVVRNLISGVFTMLATFIIGTWIGH